MNDLRTEEDSYEDDDTEENEAPQEVLEEEEEGPPTFKAFLTGLGILTIVSVSLGTMAGLGAAVCVLVFRALTG